MNLHDHFPDAELALATRNQQTANELHRLAQTIEDLQPPAAVGRQAGEMYNSAANDHHQAVRDMLAVIAPGDAPQPDDDELRTDTSWFLEERTLSDSRRSQAAYQVALTTRSGRIEGAHPADEDARGVIISAYAVYRRESFRGTCDITPDSGGRPLAGPLSGLVIAGQELDKPAELPWDEVHMPTRQELHHAVLGDLALAALPKAAKPYKPRFMQAFGAEAGWLSSSPAVLRKGFSASQTAEAVKVLAAEPPAADEANARLQQLAEPAVLRSIAHLLVTSPAVLRQVATGAGVEPRLEWLATTAGSFGVTVVGNLRAAAKDRYAETFGQHVRTVERRTTILRQLGHQLSAMTNITENVPTP